MGFLNKLLKNTSKKDLLNAVDKISDFVTEAAKEVEKRAETAKVSERLQERTQPLSSNNTSWEDYSLQRSRSELLADFKDIIARNFSEYEVLYNYEARNLDIACHPACTPIEFLFKKNGKYVLAVVIVRQNTYRGMNVIGTRTICENLGIPYLRFFEEYPNKEEYVVPRIRKNL